MVWRIFRVPARAQIQDLPVSLFELLHNFWNFAGSLDALFHRISDLRTLPWRPFDWSCPRRIKFRLAVWDHSLPGFPYSKTQDHHARNHHHIRAFDGGHIDLE